MPGCHETEGARLRQGRLWPGSQAGPLHGRVAEACCGACGGGGQRSLCAKPSGTGAASQPNVVVATRNMGTEVCYLWHCCFPSAECC